MKLADHVERAVYAATFAAMMRAELYDPRGGEVAVHEARRAIDAAERAVQLHRAAVRQAKEAR